MPIVDKEVLYTAKIIRTPALLNDTKIFLSHWDESLSIDENIKKAIERNIFGRPARSYVKQFLTAFRERYIFGDERDIALRNLVKKCQNSTLVHKILYYHTALADKLLYDFVVNHLYALHARGAEYISTKEAQLYIIKLSDEGKTTSKWSDTVCNRVARNLLTTVRDFSILEGKVRKKIAPVYLPIEVFVYVAFCLSKEVKSGNKILHHPDWRLFLLDSTVVERLFLEAHQRKFLTYQAAGNLACIEYPYKSTEEVVDGIIS